MSDPHAEARYILRVAGNDALTMANKIEATAKTVTELWGTDGLARMIDSDIITHRTPDAWAEEKRALAAALFNSADALAPKNSPS